MPIFGSFVKKITKRRLPDVRTDFPRKRIAQAFARFPFGSTHSEKNGHYMKTCVSADISLNDYRRASITFYRQNKHFISMFVFRNPCSLKS
jgi:hypothetical protein